MNSEQKNFLDGLRKVVSGEQNKKEAERFWRTTLLQQVWIQMRVGVRPNESAQHNIFFQKVLEYLCTALKHDGDMPLEIVETIIAIFDGSMPRCKFYLDHLGTTEQTTKNRSGKRSKKFSNSSSGKYAHVTYQQASQRISKFLLMNINFFGDCGGFDVLLDVIKSQANRCQPRVLTVIVKIFWTIRNYMTSEFGTGIVPQLLQHVNAALLNIADSDSDIRNVTRENIQEIITAVQQLVDVYYQDGAQEREDFVLMFCLKLLQCRFLDRRVQGLNMLNDIVKATEQAENQQRSGKPVRRRRISSKNLAEWFRDHEVLSFVLSQNFHPEVLKRLPLTFLEKQHALSTDDLTLLWESSQNKHEYATRVFYQIIEDLSTVLSEDHLRYLFKTHIEKTPPQSLDLPTLELIYKFTTNALSKLTWAKTGTRPQSESYKYGLRSLWNAVQEPDLVDDQLARTAARYLCDLLQGRRGASEREVYLGCAVENIKANPPRAVSRMVKLMRKILHTFSVRFVSQQRTQHGPPKRDAVIMKLDHKCENGLVEVLVNDLIQCVGADETRDRADGIQNRLDFLEYITKFSELKLNLDQTRRLFAVFNTASTLDCQVSFYGFITKTCWPSKGRELDVFEKNVILVLFENDMTKLDCDVFDGAMFECYLKCFLYVNGSKGNIIKWEQKSGMQQSKNLKMVGLELLWSIALYNRDYAVAEDAAQIVVDLHTNLAPVLRTNDKVAKIRTIFLQTCVKQLQNKPERALMILELFLNGGKSRKQVNTKVYNMEIRLNLKGSRKMINCQSNETVGNLRRKVAEKFKLKINEITMKQANRQLRDDSVLVNELKSATGSVEISITKQSRKKSTPQQSHDDETSPTIIFSQNNEMFGAVHRMMSCGRPLPASICWRILNIVPENKETSRKILRFDDAQKDDDKLEWEDVLHRDCCLPLLYALELIEKKIDVKQYNSEEEKEFSSRLLATLSENGGFEHLQAVLLRGLPLENHKSPIMRQYRNKAVAKMLLILCRNYFSGASTTLSRNSVTRGYEEDVAIRLLSVLDNATTGFPLPNTQLTGIQQSDIIDPARICIDYAFKIMKALVNQDTALLKSIYSSITVRSGFVRGLLTSAYQEVREALSKNIGAFCKEFKSQKLRAGMRHPRVFFCTILLEMLQSVGTDSKTCGQYFELMKEIFQQAAQFGEKFPEMKAGTLVEDVVERIIRHPLVERTEADEDNALRGLLGLAAVLVQYHPALPSDNNFMERLITEIFRNCLFDVHKDISGPSEPYMSKCKSPASRYEAFHLLRVLVKKQPDNLATVMGYMDAFQSNGMQATEWDINPQEKMKTAFVGLKNLGSTCYLNALIQQLYMVPDFCPALLQVNDTAEVAEDSILYQLQNVFRHLEFTQKKYHNPVAFCKSFKDWGGNSIDVSQQMDVNEFFNMLFEHLDNALKECPDNPSLLNDTFGGSAWMELICKDGCDHVFTKSEPFFHISLEIKDKPSIEESLKAYIQGDMLEGDNAYMCGECNKKVDALKRSSVRQLPETLILVLKRFYYDLDTMRKYKINDECSFPLELDMGPYLKREGQAGEIDIQDEKDDYNSPNEANLYDLAGVLVHSGEADHGHYYSFIKDRASDLWYEFNDMQVSPFDISNINKEAFGGQEHVQLDAQDSHYRNNKKEEVLLMEKSRNAYLLIYQKRISNRRTRTVSDKTDQNQLTVLSDTMRSIHAENASLIQEKHLFDHCYYQFLFDILNEANLRPCYDYPLETMPSPTIDLTCSSVATQFVFDVVCRAANNSKQLTKWFRFLGDMFQQNVRICHAFLQRLSTKKRHWITAMFVECQNLSVRQNFAEFVGAVLSRLAPYELDGVFEKPTAFTHHHVKKNQGRISRHSHITVLIGVKPDMSLSQDCKNVGIQTIQQLANIPADMQREIQSLSPYNQTNLDNFITKASEVIEAIEREEQKSSQSHYVGERNQHSFVIPKFVTLCCGIISQKSVVEDSNNACREFFSVLTRFAESGEQQRACLLQHGVVQSILELCTQPVSAHLQNKFNAFDFTDAFHLLEVLLRFTFPRDIPMLARPPTANAPIKNLGQLSKTEEDLLKAPEFIRKLISIPPSQIGDAAAAAIATHLCWENETYSRQVTDSVVKRVMEGDYNEFYPALKVVEKMCCLKDGVASQRVGYVLGPLIAQMEQNQRFWKATDLSIFMILRMARNSEYVRQHFLSNQQAWMWMERWLKEYPKPKKGAGTQMYKSDLPCAPEHLAALQRLRDDAVKDLKRKNGDNLRNLKALQKSGFQR